MEKMYQKYKDIAEFRLVYIREAHALGSRRESAQAKEHNIKDPNTFGERCSLAASFLDNEKLTVPTIVDDIDNTVSEAYGAFPDRLFIVGIDGKIAYAADRGPRGFRPALQETDKWLSKLRAKLNRNKPAMGIRIRDSLSRR